MKKWMPAILAVLILVLAVFIYLYFFHFDSNPMLADKGIKDKEPISTNNPTNTTSPNQDADFEAATYLIYGRDQSDSSEVKVETDLILTATLDPKAETVKILFIPPNTQATENQELKNLYANKGINGLKTGVEEITGQKIDHYIGLDYDPFVDLIDILAGIEVRMDETIDMQKYGLFIHPGINQLNGEQSLKLLRLKYGKTTVLERIERQQQVLSAVYQKLKKINNLAKIKEVTDAVLNIREKVETDVRSEEILQGMEFFTKGIDKLDVTILPGELHEGLWIPAQ